MVPPRTTMSWTGCCAPALPGGGTRGVSTAARGVAAAPGGAAAGGAGCAQPATRATRASDARVGASLRFVHDRIGQRADAGDLDLDDVAGHDGADARRRAGGDEVARLQRHDARGGLE